MKLRNNLIFIVCAIVLLSGPLSAKNDSGKNILLLGDSAAALGRGATGVSLYGVDLFYLNPAAVAESERIELGLQYGTLGMYYHNPDFSLALPTSYGVLGASLRMINIADDTNDIESGYMFSLGGSKNFTERLLMGAAFNLFYGSDPEDSLTYLGLTIGSIYKIDYNQKIHDNFGIYNPRAGASINAGVPFGENDEFADFNQLTFGYSFLFYKDNNFDLTFCNDFSAINRYEDFALKFGLESLIKEKYIARAGFTAPQSYEYGDFTLGAGYKIHTEDFDGDINYALVHYSKSEFTHYIGLNIRYGKLDKEPPVTEIKSNEEYISPNYDGRQDYLIFSPEVQDASLIKGWKLQILDSAQNIVREYRISERDIDEGLSLKGFVKKIWQKKESMVIPPAILWDATDTERKNVSDGRYTYSFVAWDERDNISTAKTGTIYVDNTPPEVELTADEMLFSPNDDKKKDTFTVKQEIKTALDDEWKAGFTDANGLTVKSYSWKGNNIPPSVNWNGKDDEGKDAPEGLYTFFIEAKDKAGNTAKAVKKGISLTRKYQTADIMCKNEYFSYSRQEEVEFTLNLSSTDGLQEWKIIIEDDGEDIISEIKGGREIPSSVKWKVRNPEGKKFDDGKYFYRLTAKYDSGNIPESFKKELIIDSTPPSTAISYIPDLFSPDEDGENDILTMFPETRDKNGIRDWSIVIYEPSGREFKSYSGKSDPAAEIKWDGIGKNNELVESAADYFIQLTAADTAGNTAKTEKVKLPIDVLVMVTERGLKIRVSNIEFEFDKAELKGKAFSILNRVRELLEKYTRYNVQIEGHTDDIGKEEYNLKLSEARAQAVLDYLAKEGINKGRMTFRGMGETMPFLPNTDDENRRRNRRVEFLLIKKN